MSNSMAAKKKRLKSYPQTLYHCQIEVYESAFGIKSSPFYEILETLYLHHFYFEEVISMSFEYIHQ